MLNDTQSYPSEVAVVKLKSCDSLALLFRTDKQRLGLIWSQPRLSWPQQMDLSDYISRKFIRENFVEFYDIDNILFNLDNLRPAWSYMCNKIVSGEVSIVRVRDILKSRSSK